MIKTILVASLVCSVITSVAYVEEESECQSYAVYRSSPHRFYFGVDSLRLHLKTHVSNFKVEGKRSYSGIRLGYEYLKPCSIYGAIDAFSSRTHDSFAISRDGNRLVSHKNKPPFFGNVELRLGYTFSLSQWLFSPFVGHGRISFHHEHCHHSDFEEILRYFTAGLRTRYELNPSFEIGCHVKYLRIHEGIKWVKYQGHTHTGHPNGYGYEVGALFVLHPGCSRKWDFQIEPYFLKLLLSKTLYAYGTRFVFGYRF